MSLFGACTSPHLITIIEYVNGGTLSDVIHKKKIGPFQKLNLAKDIASGLSYLHNELKVVHQDIKPENILVFLFILSNKQKKDLIFYKGG